LAVAWYAVALGGNPFAWWFDAMLAPRWRGRERDLGPLPRRIDVLTVFAVFSVFTVFAYRVLTGPVRGAWKRCGTVFQRFTRHARRRVGGGTPPQKALCRCRRETPKCFS
jgi:hypothetical protein